MFPSTPATTTTKSEAKAKAKVHQTKRAKQAEKRGGAEEPSQYGDGTWVVIKPPFTFSGDPFVAITNAVTEALKALTPPDLHGPLHVECRKDIWLVQLHDFITAQAMTGKEIRFTNTEGKEFAAEVKPYYVGGPTRFVTEKTEAIPNRVLAHKIANLVPKRRFVIEEQCFGSTTGPKKRVIFFKPPGFAKMDIAFGNFTIKFWPEDLTGPCHFCQAHHTTPCKLCRRIDGTDWELEWYCWMPRCLRHHMLIEPR
jgi:hypothetical protein